MNSKQKIIAGFLAVSASFLGVTYAKGGEYACDGDNSMRGAMMREGGSVNGSKMMAQRGERRLEQLRAELKITSQQEPLWQAFAEKTKAEMSQGMSPMRSGGDADKLSAPERMGQMQALMQGRLAAMQSVNESFSRLYAALDDTQKKTADAYFNHVGHGQHRSAKPKG